MKFYTSDHTQDPRGSLINLGTEENERLVPVRHVQAIDKNTREAAIPKNLLGGRKGVDERKQRLLGVANELAAHLKRVKKMFWQRTQKGQSSNQNLQQHTE